MATPLPPLLSLLTLLLSFSSLFRPSLPSSDSFLYGGCSQTKYPPNSPYESNLDSLLTSLVNSATYSAYNKYTVMGSSPQDVIYGLYQCRGDLAMPDCATCVARSVSQFGVVCPQTSGGAIQLQGCFVKYDNTSFLGVLDKTVVLKKCGPSIGYNVEAMGRRDAVLGSMGGASGPYRVGGSGDVQGVAQCVGDLSMSQCQDCLAEAIGRLKSDCGTAVYGDMFLGKCYARYSTNGAHVYSKSDGPSHGDSEKTFAIIIGLLAGVALLIIFLTFIRKIFGGNGK
ncbi:Cysteine-rich repeat secretory protein like [Actinidia chinensis var. chinensis]|uniref:Cysteine-rich repeat secretory protein like n=1 Tax=Actinidia chinensis var. chinensis TaxID=1590841 RepID=A0A2R6RDZ4_ACTCC|nr:Cysteine-rich repeat secretory protein like [Actinidia chinensis var. chinensis]